ncbi:hypothetical protein QBC36DRAFT_170991, partial [Triangularia setosa]
DSETALLKALKTNISTLGEDHPDTLKSLNRLALRYWNEGSWKEAELLTVKVLEMRQRVAG